MKAQGIPIAKIMADYAAHPEKAGVTHGIKKRFQKATMADVLHIVNQWVVNTRIKDETLISLKLSVDSLVKKEIQLIKVSPSFSILHKTNKIADLFRRIFSPSYASKRLEQIAKTRDEMNILKKTLDRKVENFNLTERVEQARNQQNLRGRVEQDIKQWNLTPQKIEAGKKYLRAFMTKQVKRSSTKIKKDEIDQFFCEFYMQKHFQSFLIKAQEEFRQIPADEYYKQLKFLTELFIQASVRLVQYQQASHLSFEDRQSLMILITLKIDIHLNLLKVETQLSSNESKTELGRTLGFFRGAMKFIADANKDSSPKKFLPVLIKK